MHENVLSAAVNLDEVHSVRDRLNAGTLHWKQTYIDVTFLTDRMPTGDEKHVASAYAISFGGNAVTAAFCCAKFGIAPELLATVADDWLGRMFMDMAARYGISIHAREVRTSSLSFIMPNDGKRAIVRCRDDDYLYPFPSCTSQAAARFTWMATSRTPRFIMPSLAGRRGRLLRLTAED